MDKLRKHINANRHLIDDQEPHSGHTDRFKQKLNRQSNHQKAKKRITVVRIVSIAASILLLFGIFDFFIQNRKIQSTSVEEDKIENSLMNDFMATNDYYNRQMEEQIADIMCKLANLDPENQEQLSTDIQKIIEYNSQFVNDIKRSENPELAIHYLIKHYKANIRALENINNKLGKYIKC